MGKEKIRGTLHNMWQPLLLLVFAASAFCDVEESIADLNADLQQLGDELGDYEAPAGVSIPVRAANADMAVSMKSCYPNNQGHPQPALSCSGGETHPLGAKHPEKPLTDAGNHGGKVNPEQCASGLDFGWCTGCKCGHCDIPKSKEEACESFPP